MDATQTLYASVSFRKVPGTLSLGPTGTIQWKPSTSNANVREFSFQDRQLNGLQVSKPEAANVALRLVAREGEKLNGETMILFTFNAEPKTTALGQREKFKERLAAAIAAARADSGANDQSARVPAGKAAVPAQSSDEVKLRGQVLLSNPSLLALHKEVVGSGIIPDSDFWAHPTRAALLRAEKARQEQRLGRRGQLADPHPTQNESGELKINMTPQLIRDLFEQYPVLTRAYQENVPNKLDDSTFWMRYFQSKLYHRLRTSLRSSASEQHLRDDDIFDKYLEAEDNEEDHMATGNAQDWTMRPGFDRRTLPLMRRFNQHAESLLTSSLGELSDENAKRVRRKTGGVGEEYSAVHNPLTNHYNSSIVLNDLQEHQSAQGRRLDIRNQHYLGSNLAADGDAAAPAEPLNDARFREQLGQWSLDLTTFAPPGAAMRSALHSMLENMDQQRSGPTVLSLQELPPEIQKNVMTCFATTNEFLQQFWQAVLTSSEVDTSASLSIDERVVKVRRMVQVLRDSLSRMDDLAEAAESNTPGSGYASVTEAFRATRVAVHRALAYAGAA